MIVNQSILSMKSHRENIVRFSKINFRITSRKFLRVPRDMELRRVQCWFDRRSVSAFPGPVFTIDFSRETYQINHVPLSGIRRTDQAKRWNSNPTGFFESETSSSKRLGECSFNSLLGAGSPTAAFLPVGLPGRLGKMRERLQKFRKFFMILAFLKVMFLCGEARSQGVLPFRQ